MLHGSKKSSFCEPFLSIETIYSLADYFFAKKYTLVRCILLLALVENHLTEKLDYKSSLAREVIFCAFGQ
jgi:hypothetical protein